MAKEPASILNIFNGNTATMTVDEAFAFIARSRRQLDNFHHLPGGIQNPIDPKEEQEIRRMLDELETTLRTKS